MQPTPLVHRDDAQTNGAPGRAPPPFFKPPVPAWTPLSSEAPRPPPRLARLIISYHSLCAPQHQDSAFHPREVATRARPPRPAVPGQVSRSSRFLPCEKGALSIQCLPIGVPQASPAHPAHARCSRLREHGAAAEGMSCRVPGSPPGAEGTGDRRSPPGPAPRASPSWASAHRGRV